MEITDLSLVEIKYLMAPKKMLVPSAFKAILQELILLKVLDNNKDFKFPNERSKKTQKYDVYVAGVNFSTYESNSYTKYVTLPFTELGQVQTKIITNFVLQRYSLPSSFIAQEIKKPLKKKGYIKEIPVLKAFGMWGITSQAKEELAKIDEYVEQQKAKIEKVKDKRADQLIPLIQEMGQLFFLLENKDKDLWGELVSIIKNIVREKNALDDFLKACTVDMHYMHH